MRGLYVNCDDRVLFATSKLSEQFSKKITFENEIDNGVVIYDKREWKQEPVLTIAEHQFLCSGWFIYKNVKNNFETLAQDILTNGIDVLQEVSAGSFIVYWFNGDYSSVLVDNFSLSHHFIDSASDKLRVAPSVLALYDKVKHRKNSILESILSKKNHLVGDYTLYDQIQRIAPASLTSVGEVKQRPLVCQQLKSNIEELGSEVEGLASFWSPQKRVLPISAGLDSRLILANGKYHSGFTYGPEGSPEILIAEKFKDDFEDYTAFDFSETKKYQQENEVLRETSYGILNPIPMLLSNYMYVRSRFDHGEAYFEGYLGDVFQRGTFITFKGWLGELLKLFPFSYRLFNFSERFLLKRRYKELTTSEFDFVWQDYLSKTETLSLSNYQKVTFYEFFYGRGGRYAIFGSNVLAGQFFTVISVFTHQRVFNTLIQQDFSAAVAYRNLKKIWCGADAKYRRLQVESGYSPDTSPIFIPAIQLFHRLLFHIVPSRANYGVKMKREQKK